MTAAQPRSKAVILAGGSSHRRWHPRFGGPTLLLPLAGRSLLEIQCEWLRRHGFQQAAVLVAEDPAGSPPIPDGLQSVAGVELTWRCDAPRQGTAGALRGIRDFLEGEPFLLLHQNLLPLGLDLSELMEQPWDGRTRMRLLVRQRDPVSLHAVNVGPDGAVLGFARHHRAEERRRPTDSLEVYYCHPDVLSGLPASGYCDLKEDLVPDLVAAGGRIEARPTSNPALLLDGPADYLAALHLLLDREDASPLDQPTGVSEEDRLIGRDIWARGMVQIAPTAEIVGPVLLEDGVVIGDRARIIGPTWLGQKVRVGESVTVRESALWEASEVAEGAWIQSSIVAKGEGVAPGESLVSRFRLGSDVEIAPGLQFLPEDRAVASNVRRGYEASKRVLDALLAGVGLLLLAPLFAVVALVIRLDSRGPVFYRELRCGRWGREFEVLKFRTMGIDASQEQLALRAASEVDGPMFKISVDPRVTRIGRFLRMSSIDELPQLVNVFRGEMSLVGPRPLKIEEMSWAPQWRDLRLTVLPGLTGLWQLRSRSSGSFDDWIKNDVGYVLGPPTLAGDLRILFETVVAWLTGRSRGS